MFTFVQKMEFLKDPFQQLFLKSELKKYAQMIIITMYTVFKSSINQLTSTINKNFNIHPKIHLIFE